MFGTGSKESPEAEDLGLRKKGKKKVSPPTLLNKL
jgi:hypothetical protein